MDTKHSETVHRDGKFLTFMLADETYGVGILKIREIIGIMPITAIPQMPPHVRGVVNLRGNVIPVMDLRRRFGMAAVEDTERTCIIVVEIHAEDRKTRIGLVVDAVSEVLNIKAEDIEDTPTFGGGLNTEFILGMAKMDGGVKILLDIDRVLSAAEVTAMANAA